MFEPAWARVSILLNLGDIAAATAAAREASAVSRWRWDFGDYQNDTLVMIYDTPLLPVGWMWFEPAEVGHGRVLLSRDVVSEFALKTPMWSFAALVTRLPEPSFRSFDVANWRAFLATNFKGPLSDP